MLLVEHLARGERAHRGAAGLSLPGGAGGIGERGEDGAGERPGVLRGDDAGAALLTQLVKANPHHTAISIRASANNPAVRLYERFGFQIVNDTGGTLTLRREV